MYISYNLVYCRSFIMNLIKIKKKNFEKPRCNILKGHIVKTNVNSNHRTGASCYPWCGICEKKITNLVKWFQQEIVKL